VETVGEMTNPLIHANVRNGIGTKTVLSGIASRTRGRNRRRGRRGRKERNEFQEL
jgi:hypothetical protein